MEIEKDSKKRYNNIDLLCINLYLFFSLRKNEDSLILPEFVVNGCYLSRNFYFSFVTEKVYVGFFERRIF